MVNMGNVWDRTTEFLSDNFSAILPIASLAILLPQIVTLVLKPDNPADNSVLVQLITVALTIPALWGQLAIVALALNPDSGRSSAQSAATRALVPAILVMLVLFAVLIVCALPVVVTWVLSGVDIQALMTGAVSQAGLTGGAKAFVLVYIVLLAIALFVVVVRLAMLYPVIVAEKLTLGAIPRSFALSRGLTWKMIGVWLVFILVYLVASLAVTSVVGSLLGLLDPGAGPYSVSKIVVAILGALVSTAFTLLIAAFSARLYLAAVAAREGSAQPA